MMESMLYGWPIQTIQYILDIMVATVEAGIQYLMLQMGVTVSLITGILARSHLATHLDGKCTIMEIM